VATGDWADDAKLDQWQCDTCRILGKCGGAMWHPVIKTCGKFKKCVWGRWVLNPRPKNKTML
jgi:hypothetical protein